jgi:hypothetical protein
VTTILGNGVAASCCAHLLGAAGMQVRIERADRSKVPALLIGAATQALIEDVFGRRDVFRAGHPVAKKVVAWGDRAEVVEVPHSGVVISEADLSERLRAPVMDGAANAHDWTIRTAPSAGERCFGSRMATASQVRLRESSFNDTCWIESVESGWLFLIPDGSTSWLLSVGAPAEDLLGRSRMVAAQIESDASDDAGTATFPAYPRISEALCSAGCGAGWLACGSAAMAFDPICGDGAGNAVREAILASAVIRATDRGEDVEALLAHYRARLISGFLKHLALCRQFYAACSGEWWASELKLLDEGIAWCREQLADAPPFRYRLAGFELKIVS